MAQKKLQRFAEIRTFPNVLEYPMNMPGKWADFFKNNQPIVLELACGKGEYAVGMAALYPEKNFIGIDLKGNRIWVGAGKAQREQLTNAAFIRSQIDKINNYFSAGEVEDIWITFPDPQLRGSKAKKRLTHPRFLRLYQQIQHPGSRIHLKTDSPDLYHFTKQVISLYQIPLNVDNDDLYKDDLISPELKIKTYYESLDIAKSARIFYLQFSLPEATLPDRDDELKELLLGKEADRRN